MKTNYSKENLFHSLPDYISNQIEDKDLLNTIEKEIEINPEFKSEYEDFKNTFTFLDSAELESPSENYFNNLSVRINERAIKGRTETVLQKIGMFWKILIPAISMIIIAILLYNSLKDDSAETKMTENTDKKLEMIEKNKASDNGKTDLIPKDDIVTSDKQNSELQNVKKSNLPRYKVSKSSKRVKESLDFQRSSQNIKDEKGISDYPVFTNSLAENVEDISSNESEDDVLFIRDSEDQDYEDEFLDLTPEEQHEILENLSKSQI